MQGERDSGEGRVDMVHTATTVHQTAEVAQSFDLVDVIPAKTVHGYE